MDKVIERHFNAQGVNTIRFTTEILSSEQRSEFIDLLEGLVEEVEGKINLQLEIHPHKKLDLYEDRSIPTLPIGWRLIDKPKEKG